MHLWTIRVLVSLAHGAPHGSVRGARVVPGRDPSVRCVRAARARPAAAAVRPNRAAGRRHLPP